MMLPAWPATATRSRPKKPGKGPKAPPFVDAAAFAGSVHAGNGCTSCHTDVDLAAHPGKPAAPVDCAACHDKAADTYAGQRPRPARKAGDTGAAQCADCHGTHDIMKVNGATVPGATATTCGTTCGQCHPDVVKDFRESIHGKAMAAGVREAPGCTDCHSEHAIERPEGRHRP